MNDTPKFIMWRYDAKQFEKSVGDLIERYQQRFGVTPNRCHVNPGLSSAVSPEMRKALDGRFQLIVETPMVPTGEVWAAFCPGLVAEMAGAR